MVSMTLLIEVLLVFSGALLLAGVLRWRQRGISATPRTFIFAASFAVVGVLFIVQGFRAPQLDQFSWAAIAGGVSYLAAASLAALPQRRASA